MNQDLKRELINYKRVYLATYYMRCLYIVDELAVLCEINVCREGNIVNRHL